MNATNVVRLDICHENSDDVERVAKFSLWEKNFTVECNSSPTLPRKPFPFLPYSERNDCDQDLCSIFGVAL